LPCERHNPLGFNFNAAWENYGEIAAFELAMCTVVLRVNSPAADMSFATVPNLTAASLKDNITWFFWRSALSLRRYMAALTGAIASSP